VFLSFFVSTPLFLCVCVLPCVFFAHVYCGCIQDEFLVMASDGLFDVMEDQSVIDAVGNYIKEHKR